MWCCLMLMLLNVSDFLPFVSSFVVVLLCFVVYSMYKNQIHSFPSHVSSILHFSNTYICICIQNKLETFVLHVKITFISIIRELSVVFFNSIIIASDVFVSLCVCLCMHLLLLLMFLLLFLFCRLCVLLGVFFFFFFFTFLYCKFLL